MQKKYTFEDLRSIIAKLRAEDGCPWDKVQTHASLSPCMMEEAAEVLAAIRIYGQTGDDENLCEELGDVLLQVMLHSQIASEENRFKVDDVIQVLCEKMIRRHPHVFGNSVAVDEDQVLFDWEQIKKEERKDKKSIQSELRSIPLEFPALTRSQKIIKKLEKETNPEESLDNSIAIIEKQLQYIKNVQSGQTEETLDKVIGELLYASSNIARLCKVHGEQALTDKIESVIEQYESGQPRHSEGRICPPCHEGTAHEL